MLTKKRSRRSGQSLIEFALLVPIVVGMMSLMLQLEQVVSSAINNARYTRGHIYFLSFNSRYYLEQDFLKGGSSGSFLGKYWVGVSRVTNFGDPNPDAKTPVFKVGFGAGVKAIDEENDSSGQTVRIKTLGFTCVAPYGVKFAQPFSIRLGEGQFSAGNFDYCSR